MISLTIITIIYNTNNEYKKTIKYNEWLYFFIKLLYYNLTTQFNKLLLTIMNYIVCSILSSIWIDYT